MFLMIEIKNESEYKFWDRKTLFLMGNYMLILKKSLIFVFVSNFKKATYPLLEM